MTHETMSFSTLPSALPGTRKYETKRVIVDTLIACPPTRIHSASTLAASSCDSDERMEKTTASCVLRHLSMENHNNHNVTIIAWDIS